MNPAAPESPDWRSLLRQLLGLPAEQVAEGLSAVLADRPDDRRDALHHLAEAGEEAGVAILAELARRPEEPLAVAAVDALALARHPRATAELAMLAGTSPSKLRRKAAARAIHRLRSRGIAVPTLRERVESTTSTPRARLVPRARLARAVVSGLDARGGRALLLAAELPSGGLDTILLIADDTAGIQQATRRELSRRNFQREREQLGREGHLLWADVPGEYGYWLAEEAKQTTVAAGVPIPSALLLWRTAISEPVVRVERPLVYEELSATELSLNPAWIETSAGLLDLEVFYGWYLDPELVRLWAAEYLQARASTLIVSEAARTERQHQIVSRAIEAIFDPATTRRYRRRLEEMALVLLANGQDRAARLALAAAIDLPPAGAPPPTRNPLLRTLVLKSFAIAQQQFGLTADVPATRPAGPRRVGNLYLP